MKRFHLCKLWIVILTITQVQGEDFGEFDFLHNPTVEFRYGKYYGQSALRKSTAENIPHGIGSFLDNNGKVLYAGKWHNGYMHGNGNLYKDDGRNYSGHFHFNQMHGKGHMKWPNGTEFWGEFRNNRMVGQGMMKYPNGHRRKGRIDNGIWTGPVDYSEGIDDEMWNEMWIDGTYEPKVKISKKVEHNYTNVNVEVVCKAHGLSPKVKLFKEDELVVEADSDNLSGSEINEISIRLPFSDDAFKVYTCQTTNDNGSIIEEKMHVRNPFFLQSHGECGMQLVLEQFRHRGKRLAHNQSARIIGGRNAYRGQVPWQAIIYVTHVPEGTNKSLGDICGGTIISPWHVLTAAHCVGLFTRGIRLQTHEILVKVGYTSQPDSLAGDIHPVKRIYIHPDFDDTTLFNDIAMIVVSKKMILGNYVNPICLPRKRHDTELNTNTELTISGFGLTYDPSNIELGWHYPSFLQVAKIRILSKDNCFRPHQERSLRFEGHFCAGFGSTAPDFHADSCSGDSGGPATHRDKVTGRHYLIGLVSAGPKLCGSTSGAVYVKVTHYLDWIRKVRLHDLIEDYRAERNRVPYEKIDSPLFRAMLDVLADQKDQLL